MLICFKTKKLQKQYEQSKMAVKAFGAEVARKYIQRINIIKSTANIKTLCSLPGLRCHPLKGDKKDYWAINLTGYYSGIRYPYLIFVMQISFVNAPSTPTALCWYFCHRCYRYWTPNGVLRKMHKKNNSRGVKCL